MSLIKRLPKYFIGTFHEHLDYASAISQHDGTLLTQGGRSIGSPGEYHGWTPDDPPTPTSVMFYIMRDAEGTPHPNWRELPHILKSTPLKTHFAVPAGQPERRAVVAAALAQTAVPIADSDTTFSFIEKLHAQMKVFMP
jgi:hypothetical protein